MSGRPSVSVAMFKGHASKETLEARAAAEAETATGERMVEHPDVRADPAAHKLFARLKRLYRKIGKDDALIGSVINRYCLLSSECDRFKADDARLRARLEELEDRRDEFEEYKDYVRLVLDIEKQIAANDGALQSKRRMLLDLEKESLMTLAAQLRSIPKKPPKDELNPFETLLKRRGEACG